MHVQLREDRGSGLVSTLAGLLVFLSFLLLAAQVLVHLLAGSFVNAAASDAARLASGAGGISAAAAREHGLSVLGPFADSVTSFDIGMGDTEVTVRVTADSPALVPTALARSTGSSSISRTIVVRRERVAP